MSPLGVVNVPHHVHSLNGIQAVCSKIALRDRLINDIFLSFFVSILCCCIMISLSLYLSLRRLFRVSRVISMVYLLRQATCFIYQMRPIFKCK